MSDSWLKIVRDLGKAVVEVRKATEDVEKSLENAVAPATPIPPKPHLPKPPWRIFLSSVMKDMAEERARVKQAVEALPGLAQAWMWEDGSYASFIKTPEEEYLPEVRVGHIFLLIVKDDVTAPVRKEYDTARQLKKPMLVFVKNCERTPAAQAVVDEIAKEVTYAVFTDSEELDPLTGKPDRLKDLDDQVRNAVARLVIDKFEIDDEQRRALEAHIADLEKQVKEGEQKIGRLERDKKILTATAIAAPIAAAAATAAAVQATSQSAEPKSTPQPGTPEPTRIKISTPELPKTVSPAPESIKPFDLFQSQIKRGHDRHGKAMIYIPAGWFWMGSEEYGDEKPIHQVYLNAYWIDETPVTNAEYQKFVLETGHRVPFYDADWAKPYNWHKVLLTYPFGSDNHPVVLVSWDDANAYARWAGKRLPTEAEWEKAARGTDGRRYPWGNEWDRSKCNSASWWMKEDITPSNWSDKFYTHYQREWEGKRVMTTPVEQFKEGNSPYGVMDLAGNVWEWCADWYDENYYKNSPARNPKNETPGPHPVLRGGSWLYDATHVRAACRDHLGRWSLDVGFRCVE